MTFPDLKGVYDHHIIHAAATPPSLDVGASWLDRVHRQKGWSMCGYHIVITRSGEIQWSGSGHRTRPIGKPGAHVGGCGPGWNERSLGTCLIGGVKEDGRTPEDNFTDAQYEALWRVINEANEAFGISTDNTIGHRDLIKMTNAAPKACPCFSVTEFIGQRKQVAEGSSTSFIADLYDKVRSNFDWNKAERPAPQRGEKLVIRNTHIVKKGETLWSISRTTGVPVVRIKQLNDIDGDTIKTGQRLRLLD